MKFYFTRRAGDLLRLAAGDLQRERGLPLAEAMRQARAVLARLWQKRAIDAPDANRLAYADVPPVPFSVRHDFVQHWRKILRGMPLSRLLGVREFWSLDFQLNDATLDPRQDTECLIEATLRHLAQRDQDFRQKPWRILDLGTGSGCIIIALLHELPNAMGWAMDKSPQAIAAARANAERHGVWPRCHFWVGDWADAIAADDAPYKFDLVLSNPPYIPEPYAVYLDRMVTDYDPELALFGGMLGLDAYARILPAIPGLLRSGGLAILEMGVEQAPSIAAIGSREGLAVAGLIQDLAQKTRAIAFGLKTDAILPTNAANSAEKVN